MRVALYSILLALVALSPACNKFGKGDRAAMEIKVNGNYVYVENSLTESKAEDEQCPDGYDQSSATLCCESGLIAVNDDVCGPYHRFEAVLQGEPAEKVEVEIANEGNRDLVIDAIYFEEGGNPYMAIQWIGGYPGPEDFPYTVAQDLAVAPIKFMVVYAPETGYVDISSATLVVESTDYRFDGKPFEKKFKMLFDVQTVGPKLQVDKKKITYGCVTGCSSMPITIDNAGTDTLTIEQIDFASPSSEFSITSPPALPLDISKKGDPDYNSLTFNVQYCPGDDYWDDTNTLRIFTNDTSLPEKKLDIVVEVKQSPAILEFSTDSPFGYLDFSEQATHSVNIFNTPASECDHMCADTGHCCGCSITLEQVVFDPPESADWYDWSAKDPTTDQALSLPRALKGGGSIQFDVTYQKPAGQTDDRNATMIIKYVAPLAGPQDYKVSMIAKSQCQFGLSPINQVLHFNSASPSDVKEKPAVILNNGSAPCVISHVAVTDQWGSVSEDFGLKEVIPGDTEVAPFSVMPVWVTYSPHTENPSGKLAIDYEDDLVGEVQEAVILSGAKDQPCAVPIADPGDDYSGAVAGSTIVLDGCSSGPGECGAPLYENGYIWYLLAKPEGSAAQLSTEGACITQFTPDVAGDYEVGLIVYDKETFYQSDFASVSFTVAD